jgi:hypothetical protein
MQYAGLHGTLISSLSPCPGTLLLQKEKQCCVKADDKAEAADQGYPFP